MGQFKDDVIVLIQQIPQGKVTTYGFIATAVGKPRGARAVGWTLAALNTKQANHAPWQRVVAANGFLTIRNNHVPSELQKQLLEKEGIEIAYNPDRKLYQIKEFNTHLWTPPLPNNNPTNQPRANS